MNGATTRSQTWRDMSVRYKDHVIMWVKEYSRTIDYLETRKDMQAGKVAYLGISWGGYMGGIIPAIEKRIKVVVPQRWRDDNGQVVAGG
jgi:cephalosporin-C deacetylase-like acetyl esterase